MNADVFALGSAALLGLMVGSFLNVVIYRLPLMMEAQWAAAARDADPDPTEAVETWNIAVPRSHCPHCGHVHTGRDWQSWHQQLSARFAL